MSRLLLLFAFLFMPPGAAAPAAPTSADLDAFVKKYRDAFTRGDTAALKKLYHVEGPHGEKAFKDEMDSLSGIDRSRVTDISIMKSGLFSPPMDAKFAPNLEAVTNLHIGYDSPKGPDSILLFVGIKDGAYRMALYVPLALSAYAVDEAAITASAATAPAPLPEKSALEKACPNEIGMFCKDKAAKAKELAACLEENSSGLTKPCRKALRARQLAP